MVDHWLVRDPAQFEFLTQAERADTSDLVISARFAVVIDDFEANSPMRMRRGVMYHVSELLAHEIFGSIYQCGRGDFEMSHSRMVAKMTCSCRDDMLMPFVAVIVQ